jgi:hypothetical protein
MGKMAQICQVSKKKKTSKMPDFNLLLAPFR